MVVVSRNEVLKQSSGIQDSGTVIWQLALLLLLAWVLVYLCLWKGIRWTGKVNSDNHAKIGFYNILKEPLAFCGLQFQIGLEVSQLLNSGKGTGYLW